MKKMKNLIYVVILTVLFVSGIAAQTIAEGPQNNPVPPTDEGEIIKLDMLGVQNSEGTISNLNESRWGNTFVLRGERNGVTAHLTISMDYTSGLPDTAAGNTIISGTWTMTVYKNDVYFGTLYGEVFTGNINWQMEEEEVISRKTEAKLKLIGGLDGYEDSVPEDIDYVLTAITDFTTRGQAKTEAVFELPL